MLMNNTKKLWQWTTKPISRKVFNVSRWIHIYLSSALFSLLMFFSFTGITLNHIDWLEDGTQQQQHFTLVAPENITMENLDTRPFLQLIHDHLGLSKDIKLQVDMDMQEVTLDYSLPAGNAFAVWDLQLGEVNLDYQVGSAMSLFNDLHKGRHTGPEWGWLIDLTASGILLFALTGFIILMQQMKRRNAGVLFALIGTLTPWLVYLLFVPRIH